MTFQVYLSSLLVKEKMNKILYIILTLLLFSLTIISCKSDDTEKVNEPVRKGGDAVNDVLDPVGEGINDGLDPVGDVVNDGLDPVGEGINDGLDSVGDVVNDGIGTITGGNTGGPGGGSESGSDEDVPIIHTKFIKKMTLTGEEYCDSEDKKKGIPVSNCEDVHYCSGNFDIKQTDDGGYIIAGCYGKIGSEDGKAWLMKTDVYGEKQWEKTYSLDDYWGNRDVIQTSDGGYLFAGWTGVLKTDSSGTMLWKKKGVPGNAAQNPYYEDVIEHSNGNYYLVGGPVAEQAIMVKISPTGSVLQKKLYGKSCADDIFRSVIESNDGKLIMVGERTHGNGPYPCSFYFRYYKNIWVVKTGKNGGKIWEEDYGDKYLEKGMDIVRRTDSDGYIVLGQKCDHRDRLKECGSDFKAVILKINEEGDKLNESFLPGLSHREWGRAMALANTHLGGYVFVTQSVPRPKKNEGRLWIKKWGSGEKNMELKLDVGLGGRSIMRTNDNGFIISITGGTIIKTDSNLSYE